MKANAPEKIFLHPDIGGREFLRPWLHRPANNESVEYVSKDVFVEKACVWIKENITNNPNATKVIGRKGCVTMGMLIKDFKKAMEE